jgi:N utilization substance protein B
MPNGNTMISRRSVRIKVAQSIYSHSYDIDLNEQIILKDFNESIEKTISLHLVVLYIIRQIFNYSNEHLNVLNHKKLLEASEKNVNLSILNTQFMKFLNEDEDLGKNFKKYKIVQYNIPEFEKRMYFKAIELTEYKHFLENPSEHSAYEFYKKFFTKIFFVDEELLSHFEDFFVNVEEDLDLIHFALKRTLKNNSERSETERFRLSIGHYEWKKEGEFAQNLIKSYIHFNQEATEVITPKLIGWEYDRIPKIEMILIKMALCEFLFFETIPTKVTINEYLDLTKIFCDPKSKTFVNGILDAILKDFTNHNKILKIGRGLE